MMNDKSKNAKRLNFHKGVQPRNPSQTNSTANVRINSESAMPKLQELTHRYIGIIDAKGFLDDLRIALGISNGSKPRQCMTEDAHLIHRDNIPKSLF